MITSRIIALNRITLECLKENNEQIIIKKITDVAIEILGADFGFVWLKNPKSKKLELIYTSAQTPFTPISPRKHGITRRVLHKKIPLLLERISKTGLVRDDAKKYLEGLATIPITFKNHTYGNIYICFKSERKFSKEDQALCSSIGNSAAQALTINRLHANLQDIKHTLDNTPEPLLIFDPATRIISYFNQTLLKHTGLKKTQFLNKQIQQIIHPSFHKLFETRLKHILEEKVLSSIFEIALKTAKKPKVPVEILLQYVNLPGQTPHLLAIFRDLREREKKEKQIRRAAYYDTVTGLPNRLLFTKRLDRLVRESIQHNQGFTILFLDMDRFKYINDTLGHLMGDSLLLQVAQRLKTTVKDTDTVSRFGGDEFLILLPSVRSSHQADRIVRRIQKDFEAPFKLGAQTETYVNFSMGIATFPKDGTDAKTLLKNADNALYQAKQHGGNSYQYYDSSTVTKKPIYLEIEKDLREAIRNKELLLQYQPIINLKTGRITSVEALVRWQHPTRGLLLPADFVPFAEESGLIVKLGEWVFLESCRQLKAWRKAKINIKMSINLSARELLKKNMIHKMKKILRACKLRAKDITLELTETFLIKNMEMSTNILKEVKKLGFKTSLDGFGTGYASLAYLKQLPVDYIKIDYPLVEGSVTNPQDAGIIQAIITVAHHLNMRVVAEGVEKKSQVAFLKAQGCDMVQGNYYSAPMPANNALKSLKKRYK